MREDFSKRDSARGSPRVSFLSFDPHFTRSLSLATFGARVSRVIHCLPFKKKNELYSPSVSSRLDRDNLSIDSR
jgi:hypothetical protein